MRFHALRFFRVLCLAMPVVGIVDVARADFDYPDFSSIADLNLFGTAAQAGTEIHLTEAVGDQTGGFYRVDQEDISVGFETVFEFQLSGDGADGFGMIIQNDGPTATTGTTGSTLGYASATPACGYPTPVDGVTSSVVVEFDTWDSGTCFGEPGTARHVAVQSNGIDPNTGNWGDRLAGEANPPNFEDGAIHAVRIVYDPAVPILRVYLDDFDTPLVDAKVDLADKIQSPTAWIGFVGATGGVVAAHSIQSWSFASNVPMTYDDCAGAIGLSIGDTCGFDTTNASNDGPTSSCHSGTPTDAWFHTTITCDGDYTISLCGSSFDTVVALYDTSGCPVTGAAAFCNDNACGSSSEITFTTTAGTDYLIQVSGAQTSDTGIGTIALTQQVGAPVNDDCSNAETYAAAVTFSTICAASEGIDPGCGSAGTSPDIWYEYTAAQDSEVTVSTAGSSYNTVLAVWAGGCPVPGDIPLACNDDGVGIAPSSAIEFMATAGDTYWIQVTGFADATGIGTLEITEFVPPDASGEHVVINGETPGLVDSVTPMVNALTNAGITPIVLDPDQTFTGVPAAIYYMGGTYPNNVPLGTIGDLIAGLVPQGCHAYVTGGDIWGFDAATLFANVDGIDDVMTADGGDNHLGAVGVAGGPLDGVTMVYTQDQAGSDWTDELVPSATDSLGPDSMSVLEDDGLNGGGIGGTYAGAPFPVMVHYNTDPGNGQVVSSSTEFGGYDDQATLYAAVAAMLGGGSVGPIDPFQRGDANGDDTFDISDAVFLLSALFVPGSTSPTCDDAADANDDGASDISDAVFMLSSLFVPGGSPPPAPGPDTCGEDPTADSLDCEEYAPCP